jgi:hypothetical protein
MTLNFTAIILCISALINFVLIWYIIQLLKRFLNFQHQLDEFVEKIVEYEDHVTTVYNMETFYGDPTLSSLLEHSKNISEQCENFKIFYFDEDTINEEEEEEEERGESAQ